MRVSRPCKCCNITITPRLADVNRGWGLYCSKSCKAIDANPNKVKTVKKQKVARSKAPHIEALTYNVPKSQETIEQELNAKNIGYTRKDLLKLLDRKMVYEWDNKIFEDALVMSNLQSAYNYVVSHG